MGIVRSTGFTLFGGMYPTIQPFQHKNMNMNIPSPGTKSTILAGDLSLSVYKVSVFRDYSQSYS